MTPQQQAIAGKKLLADKQDTHSLQLVQHDDGSPALILSEITFDGGQNTFRAIAEFDLSAIFQQVFQFFNDNA